jgi:hypothetical protein
MSTPRKRTSEETLDAILRAAEADEAIERVSKMTDEEVRRELTAAGFDLDAERAKAEAQVAELRGARKVVPIRRIPRAAFILGAAAIAAGIVFALGRAGDQPDRPVAHPAPSLDASAE